MDSTVRSSSSTTTPPTVPGHRRSPRSAGSPGAVSPPAGEDGTLIGVIDGWAFARPDSVALGAMDADFSHDANILPRMVDALANGGYDLAIGSRYVRGGGIVNWPKRRIITSRVAIALAQPLTPSRTSRRDTSWSSARRSRRRTRSNRFQDRPRGHRQSALRQSARGPVRLHRSRGRRVQAQPERDLQLPAPARAHLPRTSVRETARVTCRCPSASPAARGSDLCRRRRAVDQVSEVREMIYRPDLATNLWSARAASITSGCTRSTGFRCWSTPISPRSAGPGPRRSARLDR